VYSSCPKGYTSALLRVVSTSPGLVLLAVVVLWSVGAFSSQPLPIRISLNPAYWLLPPLLVGIGTWLLWVSGRLASLPRYLERLGADLKRAFAGWRNGSVQLFTSLAVLDTYLTVFVLLAFGMELAADASSLFLTAALCLLLLLAMVVPITVSVWGVREGAAALLWPAGGTGVGSSSTPRQGMVVTWPMLAGFRVESYSPAIRYSVAAALSVNR